MISIAIQVTTAMVAIVLTLQKFNIIAQHIFILRFSLARMNNCTRTANQTQIELYLTSEIQPA